MLSGIILCGEASPQLVVRTLAPLVELSLRGLLRDVVLAGPAAADRALIADHAGCAFIEAASERETLARATAAARGSVFMILSAGYVPEAGFAEELEDLLDSGLTARAGARLLRAAPERMIERLFPELAPAVGLIAVRELCADRGAASFRELCGAAGARLALRRRLQRIV